MLPNPQKCWPLFFLLLIFSTPPSTAAEATPETSEKLSDPSIKCDTCELPMPPPPPPPPPACSPPPPPPDCPCTTPPCPPPPPPPGCPCSTTPEVYPPPLYITGSQGHVYVTDPYGSDIYSGQKRGSVADFTALVGLWAVIRILLWV